MVQLLRTIFLCITFIFSVNVFAEFDDTYMTHYSNGKEGKYSLSQALKNFATGESVCNSEEVGNVKLSLMKGHVLDSG